MMFSTKLRVKNSIAKMKARKHKMKVILQLESSPVCVYCVIFTKVLEEHGVSHNSGVIWTFQLQIYFKTITVANQVVWELVHDKSQSMGKYIIMDFTLLASQGGCDLSQANFERKGK